MMSKSGRRRRGQAAIEYLTSYGWVILIGIIAIVIVWQSGLLQPPPEGRKAIGFSQLKPTDWGAYYEENQFTLRLQNEGGDNAWIYIDGLDVKVGPVDCDPNDYAMPISSGESKPMYVHCAGPPSIQDRFKPGDDYVAEVTITYTNARTEQEHTSVGTIYGSIIGIPQIGDTTSTSTTSTSPTTTTTSIIVCSGDSWISSPGGSADDSISEIRSVEFVSGIDVDCGGEMELVINWTGCHGPGYDYETHWAFFIDNDSEINQVLDATVPIDTDSDIWQSPYSGSCKTVIDHEDYCPTNYTMEVSIEFPDNNTAAELGITNGLHNFSIYGETTGGYGIPLEGFEINADVFQNYTIVVYNCGIANMSVELKCPPDGWTFNGTEWLNTSMLPEDCNATGWPGFTE
ncbi:hypothetical protein ACFLRC_03860 [Candidatus Altiarchaeota archaeon]